VPDFRRLFEAAPGYYLVLAPDLTIVAASDAYLTATMTTRAGVVGRPIFEVFPDNPAELDATGVSNLRASLLRALEHGRPDAMAVQRYDIRGPDGAFQARYWSPLNVPVVGADGRVEYVIHQVEDVSEFVRLRALDQALRRDSALLRTRAYQAEAEIYRRAQELQQTNAELRALHEQLESRVEQRTAELRAAHEALQSSEAQLRQSQKLEAIGRLAGGVAHDFNNLLSVILSYDELLLEQVGEASPLVPDLHHIRTAGLRAAELTQQLLAFSRQQVLQPKVMDLNDVMARLHGILSRVVGEDVELRVVARPGVGLVRADPGQLEQVLLNLVVNARDAMPQGGQLTLEVDDVELDETYARDHAEVTPGPYVMLSVSDTGIGMDKATQARVFEPFFTTKDRDKGTGLGLATVFGIVRQSHGSIWLYSEPGAGSVFKVYLPRVDGVPEPLGDERAMPPGGGHETILLVEDDAQVREVVTQILSRAGYHVLVAGDGAEALALSAAYPGPIHLLATDVVMPRESGRVLAERLTAGRPETPVLYMSGYTNDVVLHRGVLTAGMAFIQKPLTVDGLLRKVRQVIDTHAERAAR
jgi:signal transduction histidine kinase/ActR/RegA family two-component response regulator